MGLCAFATITLSEYENMRIVLCFLEAIFVQAPRLTHCKFSVVNCCVKTYLFLTFFSKTFLNCFHNKKQISLLVNLSEFH